MLAAITERGRQAFEYARENVAGIATVAFILLLCFYCYPRYAKRYLKKDEPYTKGLDQERTDGAHDYDVRAAVHELRTDHEKIQSELNSEI